MTSALMSYRRMTVLTVEAVVLMLFGCQSTPPQTWQGYVEAETLFLSSPIPGTLLDVLPDRGDWLVADEVVFALESAPDDAALEAALQEAAAIEAEIANLEKGLRSNEIRVIEADRNLAHSGIELATLELGRIKNLVAQNMSSQESQDLAQADLTAQLAKYEQASAQLESAKLGARPDLIEAAQARLNAALAHAEEVRWRLDQKKRHAPIESQVQDILFRPGEFVAAGQPVIALLPADRIKVRFFVPEPELYRLKIGDEIKVQADGMTMFTARIGFVSQKAEYTPPFIYSKENRQRFLFLVEAWPEPSMARQLHPGIPVDVLPPISVP